MDRGREHCDPSLDESGKIDNLKAMGIYANRYCLVLFVPFAIFVTLFRSELIRAWINPEFAAHSASIIPVLAFAIVVTMAGQFNSGAILIGQGKHRVYAYGLMVEAVVAVVSLRWVIPRYGILGAAYALSALLLFTHGLFPAWLVCRANQFHLGHYLRGVYLRPALAAAPVILLAWWSKAHGLRAITGES